MQRTTQLLSLRRRARDAPHSGSALCGTRPTRHTTTGFFQRRMTPFELIALLSRDLTPTYTLRQRAPTKTQAGETTPSRRFPNAVKCPTSGGTLFTFRQNPQ